MKRCQIWNLPFPAIPLLFPLGVPPFSPLFLTFTCAPEVQEEHDCRQSSRRHRRAPHPHSSRPSPPVKFYKVLLPLFRPLSRHEAKLWPPLVGCNREAAGDEAGLEGSSPACILGPMDGRTSLSGFKVSGQQRYALCRAKVQSRSRSRHLFEAFLGGTAAERQAEELPTEQGANLRLENIPQLPICPSSWHLGSTEKGMFPLWNGTG